MVASEQEKLLQLLESEYHWIYDCTSLFCSWRWEQYNLLHEIFAIFPNSTKLWLLLNFLCHPYCHGASTLSYDRCSKVGACRVLHVEDFVWWPWVGASTGEQALWTGRGGTAAAFSLVLGTATRRPPRRRIHAEFSCSPSVTGSHIFDRDSLLIRFNALTLPRNHPVAWDIR